MTHSEGDPRLSYDAARDRCPVQRQEKYVVVYGHPETAAVVTQPEVFSSGVSRFLQLPNGLGGTEHAQWRALIDPYLTSEESLAAVETIARQVMTELLAEWPRPVTLEAVSDLGARYAVRVQQRWLEWQPENEGVLLDWVEENRRASRSGDTAWTARVAEAFDSIIRAELARRAEGALSPGDVTARLMADRTLGRPLETEEIVSILRNWTAGDLGSLALCIGVVVVYLAKHPELQTRLRSGVSAAEYAAVLDEILRIDDPFVANRRRVTQATELGGVALQEGDVVQVNWTAANRDPRVFAQPNHFDPHGHAANNLVYGLGPHACPGRLLSTLELRVFAEELLRATTRLELAGQTTREAAPGGGYATVPLTLR